jgi:uncharacterized lipoprotein YehR (DUF1307 family)
MTKCDVDEVVKQIKTLDTLRQLKKNMDEETVKLYPELSGIFKNIDSVIEKQTALLENTIDECGQLDKAAVQELSVPETDIDTVNLPELEDYEKDYAEMSYSEPDSEIEE